MERDKKIEKIVKENSLLSPSANFTESVINKIRVAPLRSSYRPLIGRRASYIAISLVAIILIITIFSSQSELADPLLNLPEWGFKLPELEFGLQEIDWKIPSGILAGIVAIFILVLTDARLSRSRS